MTDLPQSDALDLHLGADGWLTVWFNYPSSRNPLTRARIDALTALCDHLDTSRGIRGVVLRGRGGVFCAGGDLKAFKSVFQDKSNRDDVIDISLAAATLLERLSALPQFTVVIVEGAAMAGGFGLTCVGDYAIGEAQARFALTEVRIGITPAQIAPFVVERVGLRNAKLLMLTGETIGAQKAAKIGLVDEVAEGEEALEAALAGIKSQVQKAGPSALAAVKRQLTDTAAMSAEARKRYAAELFAKHMLSDEGREGITSFFEKRAPRWAGT